MDHNEIPFIDEEDYVPEEGDEEAFLFQDDENGTPPQEVKQEEVKEKKGIYIEKKYILIFFIILAVVLSSFAILSFYSLFRDSSIPQAIEVHIESDSYEDNTIAKYGNMITLSFSFDQKIKGVPSVTILGKEVEVYGSGKSFHAKYFVQDQDYEDTEVTFSISNYQNAYHKKGRTILETTDGSHVVIPAIE